MNVTLVLRRWFVDGRRDGGAASLTTRQLLVLALGVTIVGCVPFPHKFVHSPDLKYFVSDEAGLPVDGALAKFYSADTRDGAEHTGGSTATDLRGQARISEHTDTHFVVWLIPGMSNRRYFAWCVSAPGFARQGGRLASGRPEVIRVQLIPSSNSDECPSGVRSLDELVRGPMNPAVSPAPVLTAQGPGRRAGRNEKGLYLLTVVEPGYDVTIKEIQRGPAFSVLDVNGLVPTVTAGGTVVGKAIYEIAKERGFEYTFSLPARQGQAGGASARGAEGRRLSLQTKVFMTKDAKAALKDLLGADYSAEAQQLFDLSGYMSVAQLARLFGGR